jgi:hypothetical protein
MATETIQELDQMAWVSNGYRLKLQAFEIRTIRFGF